MQPCNLHRAAAAAQPHSSPRQQRGPPQPRLAAAGTLPEAEASLRLPVQPGHPTGPNGVPSPFVTWMDYNVWFTVMPKASPVCSAQAPFNAPRTHESCLLARNTSLSAATPPALFARKRPPQRPLSALT